MASRRLYAGGVREDRRGAAGYLEKGGDNVSPRTARATASALPSAVQTGAAGTAWPAMRHWPDSVSSLLPDAYPSGVSASHPDEGTVSSVVRCLPVLASNSRTRPSKEPAAARRESGDRATA